MNRSSQRPGAKVLWLMGLLFASTTMAGTEVDEFVAARLKNRAFCSPNVTFPLPQTWQERAIEYEYWAKGSDMAITLDQQIYQLLLPLIQDYGLKKHLNIRVREGTCGMSAGMVSRKAVDIAGFCCPPALNDRLPGLTFHTLGIASIAILVHPDNPIRSLTLEQVRKIFQGQPRQWSQVKDNTGQLGPAWSVQTIGRLHCKLRPGHWRALLSDPDDFSPRMEEVGTIPDMIQRIMVQRGGVGFETLWHVERYKGLGIPKFLFIDNHAPDDIKSLLAGDYPFYHVFNLTLWEGKHVTNAKAEELVNYLIKAVEAMDPRFSMIAARKLRQAGWPFHGNELIGEPKR
ncbi:MAG: hypothetical protein H7839_24250 [Magnetococcus sp. YQC-5]